ncbi:Na+/melibiose symporter [Thiohalobacter thiocyanaticus]|uniref:Na+/melibiose symporter n=1 Tax=Thiohalobacter thiocyanaticus TaxID=585455 RepID=A0A1Z4VR60_9GAMM|nr:MFS transporter [Thiohalobacter thiocyanaticus]BAZ94121.1 Na+/melibiose symporter [Thiohalobacter thiocyanaticus]
MPLTLPHWQRTLLAYGVTGLPLAALGLPLYVFLPAFYAGLPEVGLAAAGIAILLARSLDVFTDPLIGYWCDRSSQGSRLLRPLMLAGTLLLLFGISRLFMPPADVGGAYLFLWSLVSYTGWTLITVPYLAWGAELTQAYHARTSVTVAREAFTILGTMLMIALPLLTGHTDQLARLMQNAAWLLYLLLPTAVLVTLAGTPAPGPRRATAPGYLRALMEDPLLRRLSLAFFSNSMANAIPASLIILYVETVLQAGASLPLFLGAYFFSGLVALPLWQALARRLGKARTWALSMLLASLAFLGVLVLGPGDVAAFTLICLLTGASLGIDMALPASIQADVAEQQRLVSGQHRTGTLFGLWSLLTKLALAMAVGIAFPLLSLSGFESGQPATATQTLWLTLLYALLPVIIKLYATWLVWRLPLTETNLLTLRDSARSREETDDKIARTDSDRLQPAAERRL